MGEGLFGVVKLNVIMTHRFSLHSAICEMYLVWGVNLKVTLAVNFWQCMNISSEKSVCGGGNTYK